MKERTKEMSVNSKKFKHWLSSIANDLSPEDTKNITYMCKDGVEEDEWDSIHSGQDLVDKFNAAFTFTQREELEQLAEIFRIIGKIKLQTDVKKFLEPDQLPKLLSPADFQKPGPNFPIRKSDYHAGNEGSERRPSETSDGSTAGQSVKKIPQESFDYETTSEGNKVVAKNDCLPGASRNQLDEVGHYEMKKIPRGVCIIINNTFKRGDGREPVKTSEGDELKERTGTDVDKERLKSTFEWLQFQVYVETDLTAEGIRNLFENVANGFDIHGNLGENSKFQEILCNSSDCFVFCILSHGCDGGIYGVDGKCVKTVDIKKYLAADKCSHLAGKPKLGFMQACRGSDDSLMVEKDAPHRQPVEDNEPPDYLQNQPKKSEERKLAAAQGDIFMYAATTQGYASYRHAKFGSLFIRTVCDVFQKHAFSKSLSQMKLLINRQLSSMPVNIPDVEGSRGQAADAGCDSLNYDIYFGPENEFDEYMRSKSR